MNLSPVFTMLLQSCILIWSLQVNQGRPESFRSSASNASTNSSSRSHRQPFARRQVADDESYDDLVNDYSRSVAVPGTILGTPDLRDAMSSPIMIGRAPHVTALSVSASGSPSSSAAGSFVVHRVGLRKRKGAKSFVSVSPPLGGADQVRYGSRVIGQNGLQSYIKNTKLSGSFWKFIAF